MSDVMSDEWGYEEIRARRELEKLDPDNDALKYIYHSTRVAVEAYWDALAKHHSQEDKKK